MTDRRLLDRQWRLNNLYKITNKDKEVVKFKKNAAQRDFEKNRHTRNIILKSRQLGFTTDECIDALDETLFTKNNESLFIAHEQQEASKIFDKKIDYAWKSIRPEIRDLWTVDAQNAKELRFGFGDGKMSSISVATSGRSGTYNRVHVSEFAKMQNKYPRRAEEVITGTIPSVPLDGRVDIESTAEGEFGYFHDMFWDAWERKRAPYETEFKAHFYNWTWDTDEINKIKKNISTSEMENPEFFASYQKKHGLSEKEITYYYLKWLSLEKNWSALRQEYPTTPEEAFVSSGDRLFDPEALDYFEIEDGIQDGSLTVYEEYNPLHTYAIGGDVSEGIGRDSATAVVLDVTADKVVAEYADNRVEPDVFGHVIASLGRRYGTCLIAVERNNTGLTTLVTLKENYPLEQIYSEEREDRVTKQKTDRLGYPTNAATKPRMLFELNTAVNEQILKNPSAAIKAEMRTYDKNDIGQVKKKNDEQTRHWDLLMALAIAWQMRTRVSKTTKVAYKPRPTARRVSKRRKNPSF